MWTIQCSPFTIKLILDKNGGILLDWILQNKEWFFSGAGLFIISTIITLALKNNKQSQKIGDNSKGIQVGGDLKVGESDEKK